MFSSCAFVVTLGHGFSPLCYYVHVCYLLCLLQFLCDSETHMKYSKMLSSHHQNAVNHFFFSLLEVGQILTNPFLSTMWACASSSYILLFDPVKMKCCVRQKTYFSFLFLCLNGLQSHRRCCILERKTLKKLLIPLREDSNIY